MTQFPAVAAGQKITAALLTQMEPMFAYKAADTPRASTTAVAADPDLQLSLQAGTYLFDAWVLYNGAAIGTGDLKCTFASGASLTVANYSMIGCNSTAATQVNVTAPAFGSSTVLGTNGTGAPLAAQGKGSVVVTSTVSLQFFWAQNTSSATATTVKAGSWLAVWQIA